MVWYDKTAVFFRFRTTSSWFLQSGDAGVCKVNELTSCWMNQSAFWDRMRKRYFRILVKSQHTVRIHWEEESELIAFVKTLSANLSIKNSQKYIYFWSTGIIPSLCSKPIKKEQSEIYVFFVNIHTTNLSSRNSQKYMSFWSTFVRSMYSIFMSVSIILLMVQITFGRINVLKCVVIFVTIDLSFSISEILSLMRLSGMFPFLRVIYFATRFFQERFDVLPIFVQHICFNGVRGVNCLL